MVASQNQAGQTVVSSYSYTVNAIGQRTNLSQSGTAFPASRDVTWGYDILGQITGAATSDHSADRAYQFDAIGNRLSRSAGVPPASSTATYTSNSLNQYSAIADPQTATIHPQFDDDGNATAYLLPVNPSANSTLTWDAENRLISTTINGVATTFLYDAQSRRIAKTTGAATTLYLYDGWNGISDYTIQNSTFSIQHSYLCGADLSGTLQGAGGVGGLLMAEELAGDTVPYHYLFDGNGNVTEITDSQEDTAARYRYDVFGNTLSATGPYAATNRYRFSTKPLDAEVANSPLYYYGYRYYDPVTGRWLSRDPINERGGVNLYGYVGNDGMNKADFLGKVAVADDVVVGGYLAGAALAAYLATPSGQKMVRDLAAAAASAAEATRCAAIKAACVAKCTRCLPSREYSGDKFYKCMADCMSGSGCYGN